MPLSIAVIAEGSSPPARGLRELNPKKYMDLRLIPACAGTTEIAKLTEQVHKAHPRLRGDY